MTLTRTSVVKRYRAPFTDSAALEASFYQRVPWACPPLLGHGKGTLLLKRLPTALELPNWRPILQLYELLERLHDAGVNHRDVHLGNIVRGEDGEPLLIDWEDATTEVGALSYDLWGPRPETAPRPPFQRGLPTWVGSDHKTSVTRWGFVPI